jgi:hypothetical protein
MSATQNIKDVFFGSRRRTEWTLAFMIGFAIWAMLYPEVMLAMLDNLLSSVTQIVTIVAVPLVGLAFLKHVFTTKPGPAPKKKRKRHP